MFIEEIKLSQYKCSCLNVKRITILYELRKILINGSRKTMKIFVPALLKKVKNQMQSYQKGLERHPVHPYTGSPIKPR